MPFCWSWSSGWKRKINRVREHWFWRSGHLLHTSTQSSGKFQTEPLSVFFIYLFICFFGRKGMLLNALLCLDHWILQIRLVKGKIPRLMSRVHYKYFMCTYLWWNSVYIYLYSCTSCKYIFTFFDLEINVQILSYFCIFCWTYTQREL